MKKGTKLIIAAIVLAVVLAFCLSQFVFVKDKKSTKTVETTASEEKQTAAPEEKQTAAPEERQTAAPEEKQTAVTESEKSSDGAFHYVHDPRLNPSAMKDIIEDPSAVYGFSPSPDSERLAVYAELDWTDPAFVEEGRQDRIAYHQSIADMYSLLRDLEAEGKSTEEIARAVSARRNEIRLEAAADDPEKLALTKKSNLEKYGNENGPDADSLYEKYGSWEMVIEKAFSANSGMDACLGLYDDYYELYVIAGQIPGESVQEEETAA